MNCEFCQQVLKFSHHENGKEIEVYDCHNCPVLTSFYYFHEDGSPAKTCFTLDRNEKTYLWTNNYVKGKSYIQELKITSAPGFDSMVLELPKLINVTPSNVNEKFSFYMIFA